MKTIETPFEVYRVEPDYILNGKQFLAYPARNWPKPFSTHEMKYIGTVNAAFAGQAITRICNQVEVYR